MCTLPPLTRDFAPEPHWGTVSVPSQTVALLDFTLVLDRDTVKLGAVLGGGLGTRMFHTPRI